MSWRPATGPQRSALGGCAVLPARGYLAERSPNTLAYLGRRPS